MKIHFCDLCNESVPQQAIEAGNVVFHQGRVVCMPTVLAGRVVCGVCRRPMEPAAGGERVPDPHRPERPKEARAEREGGPPEGKVAEPVFCDLCNESLPQQEVDAGRVSTSDGRACGKPEVREGRVVCQVCDRVLVSNKAAAPIDIPAPAESTAAAPAAAARPALVGAQTTTGPTAIQVPAPQPTGGGSGALWVALVALLFSGATVAYIGQELGGLRESVDATAGELRGELGLLQGRQAGLDASRVEDRHALDVRMEELSRDQAQTLASLVDEIRSEAGEAGRQIVAVGEEIGALRKDLDERRRADDERFYELNESLLRFEEDMRFHADRLAELELALESGAGLADAGGGAADPAGGDDRLPPWQGLLADLANPNAGIRWEAVDALGQTRDPAVVVHLVPMLKDVDLFVRMATARVLGDLGSIDAVPHLIDALEDTETAMREQAVVSLRAISGRNFKFDPLAKESERAKKVKAWREWWKREEADRGKSNP